MGVVAKFGVSGVPFAGKKPVRSSITLAEIGQAILISDQSPLSQCHLHATSLTATHPQLLAQYRHQSARCQLLRLQITTIMGRRKKTYELPLTSLKQLPPPVDQGAEVNQTVNQGGQS